MNRLSIDDLKGFSTNSNIVNAINDLIDEVELLKVKIISLEEANIDLEEANSNLKEVLTDHLQMYFDAT